MKIFRAVPFVILVFALLWYVALAARFPTAGAIGDDPATYVLMARELAQRGTVTHEFPLFTNLFDRKISWDALIPPGYHVVPESGTTAPNFAWGLPLLLAIAYRILGEGGIYRAVPLMGALTLFATFALGNELLCEFSPVKRRTISALAVLILAAAPKQIQLVLVPMSDVPTQLFCLLALWCALRIEPRPQPFSDTKRGEIARDVLFALLCGFALGMAYLMRHSALAMLVPLVVVMTRWGATKRLRVVLVFGAAAIFVLTISPDVLYRANMLGNAFAVESPESAQIVWLDAPRQLLQMLVALFSVTGFGPLVLFVPFGSWILARDKHRFTALVLAEWVFSFMLLHAPLKLTGVFENNLRYLIPAYPAFALSAGVALFWTAGRARDGLGSGSIRFAKQSFLVYAIALVGIASLAIAFRAIVTPERFAARAYGWMSQEARQDLDGLNAQLPHDAVIGTSDQMAGVALLYAQREVFRPANFLEPAREFPSFLKEMKRQGRAVYVLGNWNCAESADASERLPEWIGEYRLENTGLGVRGLPFGCEEQLHRIE